MVMLLLEERFYSRRSDVRVAYLCQCLIKRDTPYFLQSVQEEIK